MMSKVSVLGDDKTPLYQFLTDKSPNPQFAGDIKWNFTKFLFDRNGKPVARFEPDVTPDSPQVTAAIEAALGQVADALELTAIEGLSEADAVLRSTPRAFASGTRCWRRVYRSRLSALQRLFISFRSFTSRANPCSRAVLFPGTVLPGSSPARMNPWPAPS